MSVTFISSNLYCAAAVQKIVSGKSIKNCMKEFFPLRHLFSRSQSLALIFFLLTWKHWEMTWQENPHRIWLLWFLKTFIFTQHFKYYYYFFIFSSEQVKLSDTTALICLLQKVSGEKPFSFCFAVSELVCPALSQAFIQIRRETLTTFEKLSNFLPTQLFHLSLCLS